MARSLVVAEDRVRWGLLLDLDETLVITSALEPLRRARRWQDVYRSFPKTRLPPGTREFLRLAGALAQAGAVTTAPRTYAERLLKYHGLDLPVLVAYHDVVRKKPHPEPILTAADKLGIPPDRCICVGDSVEDALAATAAGAFSVKIWWGSATVDEREPRDAAVCHNWDDVLLAVRGIIQGNPG